MSTEQFLPETIDVVVFDVIGTLVDEDGAWATTARQLAVEAGLGSPEELHSRWTQLLNRRMNAVVDGDLPWQRHSHLVSDGAHEAITALGGTVTPAALALVATLDREYPAWPDVAEATAALRRGRLVVGVSNGDLDSLARLANSNAISWDIALSTGAAGTFKPAPAAYRYAIDTLGLVPGRTLFVAAHPWDLRAAADHGFRTAYLARPGAEAPSAADQFDLTVEDLARLTTLLG
ncbi:HAD-IA family hydrolase [Curtobacterium sp. ISL-83]|uniref:HAD-IA family hydrolase n=1 Tax=Curtobacterium sp. ISL-83 TaxID=2819145 RepID=UPI001BECC960|nr:HAD-IA family hydrolase [Curtobacterium sp. ISL-83]MBT2504262.1 HAD-IA family hydrolase [Curtobacterium sp. ISL-83]